MLLSDHIVFLSIPFIDYFRHDELSKELNMSGHVWFISRMGPFFEYSLVSGVLLLIRVRIALENNQNFLRRQSCNAYDRGETFQRTSTSGYHVRNSLV